MLGISPTESSRVSSKDRRQLAGFIRSALRDANGARPLLRGYRPLIRRSVALACKPALERTLTTLEDSGVTLDASAIPTTT